MFISLFFPVTSFSFRFILHLTISSFLPNLPYSVCSFLLFASSLSSLFCFFIYLDAFSLFFHLFDSWSFFLYDYHPKLYFCIPPTVHFNRCHDSVSPTDVPVNESSWTICPLCVVSPCDASLTNVSRSWTAYRWCIITTFPCRSFDYLGCPVGQPSNLSSFP